MKARLQKLKDGRSALLAPTVGSWVDGPALGTLIRPGVGLGAIEVLGVRHPLSAPEGAYGVIVADLESESTVRAVDYASVLVTLDPSGAGPMAEAEAAAEANAAHAGEVFTAPMSGRFYLRPAPDKPPFLREGDELTEGQTVCLLEVMKTFNRVTYGGAGLPDHAKVARIVPADGDDVAEGDTLLELSTTLQSSET